MVSYVIDHSRRASPVPHEHAAPAPKAPSPPVAMPPVSVNGVTISRKAIAAEVQNFPARNPGEGWRAATQALVIRELLRQEARRLDVAITQQADAGGRLETAEDAQVRVLLEQEVKTPRADEATLRRFYENNRQRFATARLYEADHILFAARREDGQAFATARDSAASVRDVLAREPERFAEFARARSDCPSGKLGGSLGQIGPGDTTAEFERALAALSPGEISAPVETRYGVHIIRLAHKIEGRQLPFEAVRERIEAYLEESVRRRAAAQYLALLIGRAEIRGIALDGVATPLVQ